MNKRPWDGVVSEADLAVYRAAGFGQPAGLGKRPALLIIDVQYRTVGESPKPILEAIRQYPTACGEVGWKAVARIAELLAVFRKKNLPVLYPCIAPKGAHDTGGFATKAPGVLAIPPRGYEFVADIAPKGDDLVLPKTHASAFFGTALASYLVRLGVDTLVLTGCTTSGCIRATAVDACSLNYRVVVPEETCYDRGEVSHAVNLFDMASKYADVMPLREAVALIDLSRS
ncbi:MAG: isochorismatase family protein [Betaproteobacteria bacterium]|nr:isochorismatase family protein [Betaproteobacteria bacterium]